MFLRDVTPKGFRAGVQKAIDEIAFAGVPIVWAPALDAAAHKAEELGLVEPGTAERKGDEIRADRDRLETTKWPQPFGHRAGRADRGSARGDG